MRRILILILAVLPAIAGEPHTPLLQKPTLSRTHIVFSAGGDLWSVPRAGGDAVRLTSAPGLETDPSFSPDGTKIAFTGQYEGNLDIYVVDAGGGDPKRLTWHPAEDNAVGWTPDGKNILFRSGRYRERRLFTVPAEGGPTAELPFPKAAFGAFSPDGKQLVYMPIGFNRPANAFDAWKRYRGGRTTPIWIAQLSDSAITARVPRDNSNDSYPMWIGNVIYFISDRDSAGATLYSFDLKSQKVTRLLSPSWPDVRSASAGPGGIVYERFGEIRLFDPQSRKDQAVSIRVAGDLAAVRPRFVPAAKEIRSAALSPTGQRAVFEVRGEVITVPAEKGDARNVTNTPGAYERTPSWSPDGKWIAYWSDEKGEYNLYLQNQSGFGEPRMVAMEEHAFFFEPQWSPDSKKLAFTDNKLNLWVVDIEKNTQKKVDTDTYYEPLGLQRLNPAWSPDSRWLAYTKLLKNRLRAVFVHSLESDRSEQITDGLSDARNAQFDRDGKYLFFAASTDAGLTPNWLDMTSQLGRPTRSIYLVVLRKDLPSPFAPESDEEKAVLEDKKDEKKPEKTDLPPSVSIDFENIGQRILAVPVPARDYADVAAGKAGTLYLVENTPSPDAGNTTNTVHRFDMKTRKVDKLVEGVTAFALSANGEKMLFRQGDKYMVASAAAAPKAGEGVLKTDTLQVAIDPRAEWKQMYNEVWRIQRDWFYDPAFHGLDLQAQAKRYEPYLDRVASRGDLNYLFEEMLGAITVGHLYVRGGDVPQIAGAKVGLLGADYEVAGGHYRFARVFNGENWNPDLKAPLTQPGVNVAAGDYLLAVNGRAVDTTRDVHSWLEGTAGKQTVLRVGPDPGGANGREVTVVPIESEAGLRMLAWAEDNRRKVSQMTGGRIAYVYLPDTGDRGFAWFNRYYFSQVDREGAILDERFNGGGQAADYIIDFLNRPLMNHWTTRYGQDFTTPRAIFGPKVMIVNESAGSGGDLMPWYFRRTKAGPLIGMRTWGGLVGILGYPALMDGGTVTAPNVAFWSPEGKWEVENTGVAPDIEVDLDPKAWREGHDAQLEKSVEVILELLKKQPLPSQKRPTFPDYNSAFRASQNVR